MKPIKRDMIIGDLVEEYPESAEILLRYGIHCFSCFFAANETLEQGTMGHGMSEEDFSGMMKELKTLEKEIARIHAPAKKKA